jgi:hypothetical protein
LPPEAKPLGVSYGDWFGHWWNWLVSFPEDESPALVDNCNANQSGKVFFLPHTFFGNTLETSCTVPTGTIIFATAGVRLCAAGGNIFGLPAGTTKSVAGGWHAILTPLPPGEHTIIVHDELISGEIAEAVVHLTVVAGH